MLSQTDGLRLFRTPDADGGGTPPAQTATATPAAEETPAPPPAADTDGNGAGGVLTQVQVNELMGTTRAKAKATGRNSLLQELGFTSLEEANTFLAAAKAKADADKSELQLAQEQLATLGGIQETSTAQAEQLTAYETAVTAQVDALKKSLSIPDYVVALLDDMPTVQQLTYISKHQESFTKTAKPPKPNINGGDGSGGSTPADPKEKKAALLKRFPQLRN